MRFPALVLGLLFASMFVFAASSTLLAQESAKKPAKGPRWEGTVIRIGVDKSNLDVRQANGAAERTIFFDSATVWTSYSDTYKTAKKIDASQVKEGDFVICLGTVNEKGEFHATTISKRLSPLLSRAMSFPRSNYSDI
jgi:hypothetical protein